MKWWRLKGLKCPKCALPLQGKGTNSGYGCTNQHCDFHISSEKFQTILLNMEKQDRERNSNPAEEEERNLHRLNNLKL